ncbi:MAG: bifunctional phosphopantothenoylcysteine decarboxylase/phosphopantothenate--cysteine ligase CoaBC [Chloroflexota bacterium]|nr:bifunctional phosphopantothenoylcysteine decarboxylase/phosphopantothenate--cysteine ligase CoaBC [Chloroflexota bacterium]MDE2941130.1 bifunctional phosphopantothenoylcysteine decarboxylase/phosphopantothenate--cysteine ligase CoaBC [Chloroflexota bacterium]MDE3267344.1 bifunctional phosphopantothenoylcysteine decarboxylase/phosphopantothenate--cysteine ligase CoaBC [Chloroflexota bacterium]
MNSPLVDARVVLGVTGSIACYKAADLASKLTQAGALVDVILSHGASNFVTPLTFRSLTHRPVVTDLFDADSEQAVNHVAMAHDADVVLVAPATAHVIARLAHGFADDALTTTALASAAPLVVAPAMDGYMFDNPATQENLETLRRRGATIIGPESGHLASGLSGMGRMSEPAHIVDSLKAVLGRRGDMAGRAIVVSAGGTQEPIDPVRVITNRSSGKMGYAIAEAARDRGASVTLVTAPTSLPDPVGVELRRVATVAEMREAVLEACTGADAVIMAAAVSDYRPAEVASQKIKKGESGEDGLVLQLVKNDDFFLEVPAGVLRVGFAAESEDLVANARGKLESKGLALIAANDITQEDSGFNVDTNRVVIIGRDGTEDALPLLTKYQVGHRLLDRVMEALAAGRVS